MASIFNEGTWIFGIIRLGIQMAFFRPYVKRNFDVEGKSGQIHSCVFSKVSFLDILFPVPTQSWSCDRDCKGGFGDTVHFAYKVHWLIQM